MGRPQFESVIANAPREHLEMVDLSQTLSIAPGITKVISLYAPSGQIGQVMGIYLHKPIVTGATTGTHVVEFGYPTLTRAYGKSHYNDEVRFVFSNWDKATYSQGPSSDQTQMSALQSLYFDDTQPLYFAIRNDTNVTDNAELLIRAMIKYSQISA